MERFPSGDGLTISPLICSRFRNCVYTYRILPDKENKLIVQVSHAVHHLVPQRCTQDHSLLFFKAALTPGEKECNGVQLIPLAAEG